MLFNREDLDYTVVSEVIINGTDIVLLGETNENMNVTIYQVVRAGGVELTTLDALEAKTLFNEYIKELLNIKLSILTSNI